MYDRRIPFPHQRRTIKEFVSMKVILGNKDKERYKKLEEKLKSEAMYIEGLARLNFESVSSADVDIWNKLDKILK